MRVRIPHNLGKDEACRRLRSHTEEIADFLPSGANVSVDWPSDDRAALNVRAMGQKAKGSIEIEETHALFTLNLPMGLMLFESKIKKGIEANGRKLLT